MPLFKAEFNNFELYQKAAEGWEIDFRLLSKTDFVANLQMFFSEKVGISRTSTNGTIEQFGLTPKNQRSIAIPIKNNLKMNWFHQQIEGNQLLIFPKDRTIDVTVYEDFDVFVVTIDNDYLAETINALDYKNCEKIFSGNEELVTISEHAIVLLRNVLFSFLIDCHIEKSSHKKANEIVCLLLKYIELGQQTQKSRIILKSEIGFKRATQFIQDNLKNTPSITELCKIANISERSLQYAFQKKYQVTPGQYIRINKLNGINRELNSRNKEKTTISDIVRDYDIWHMGQFAADFKTQFGCLPSEIRNLKA